MTRNKTKDADLESKRGLFFQIGLSAALAAALIVMNIETVKPAMEDTTVKILGLEIKELGRYNGDTVRVVEPPKPHRGNLEKNWNKIFKHQLI